MVLCEEYGPLWTSVSQYIILEGLAPNHSRKNDGSKIPLNFTSGRVEQGLHKLISWAWCMVIMIFFPIRTSLMQNRSLFHVVQSKIAIVYNEKVADRFSINMGKSWHWIAIFGLPGAAHTFYLSVFTNIKTNARLISILTFSNFNLSFLTVPRSLCIRVSWAFSIQFLFALMRVF